MIMQILLYIVMSIIGFLIARLGMLENPRRERVFAWFALLSPLWPVTVPLLVVWGAVSLIPLIIIDVKDLVSDVVKIALRRDV